MMAGSMMDWLDMVTAPTRETSRSNQGTVAARQTVRMLITALAGQTSSELYAAMYKMTLKVVDY